MSKRYLRKLVETGLVDGWDDPRMPTLCGLRRKGYTPESIFEFIRRTGVSKANSLVAIEQLEACVRDELNQKAERRIAILKPIKLVITNYPEDQVEYFDVSNNPSDPTAGTRKVSFSRNIYIDRDDFMEEPMPKFFRLKPDGEVRLMGAYIVKCNKIEKNADGEIECIYCTADLETANGNPVDGRKIKGTIHWLSEDNAAKCTVKLYDKLFTIENTGDIPEDKTYDDYLNPNSVITLEDCLVEKCLTNAEDGEKFQFVRTGYFAKDTKYPNTFNRIVTLKDGSGKKNS